MTAEHYDFFIVGGGLFGVYAAHYLSHKGHRVLLVEKEAELMKKASIVNQARLHGGYHYPRSVATARMSDDNKARFTREHQAFINQSFDKYYAIDRYGSFTDAQQFERFCAYMHIRCERVPRHPLFNYNRLEAVFLTTEYSFDPLLIAEYYRSLLADNPRVTVWLSSRVSAAVAERQRWRVVVARPQPQPEQVITADQVINATYANSNAINQLFGADPLALMHEISEMAFVTSPQLHNTGLTIMDGPFASLMPYGLSGLLSLSSVAYTHHKVSYELLPTFDCQATNPACTPGATAICSSCDSRPATHYPKMEAQLRQYLAEGIQLDYFCSMFTIKSKLKANYIDDGRPTEIALLRNNPPFYCIFAGKINSIYEIERVVDC